MNPLLPRSPLETDADLERAREWARTRSAALVDFEENLRLPAVRCTLRVWKDGEELSGLAYVDGYDNLWFDTAPSLALEDDIIAWGETCIRERYAGAGMDATLDCSCPAGDARRIRALLRNGFVEQAARSLHFFRSLGDPIPNCPLPDGISIRCVQGSGEAPALAALHRAAFGTEHMTVEGRLAIMDAPGYRPELDLVVVAPGGELAAFCICELSEEDPLAGSTDPIGTHPRYRHMGLAKCALSAGLGKLKAAGACTAQLGTSSENIPMQQLARAMGFTCLSEKMWFSKSIPG